uniref:uncharacterized protein LOC120341766 n=1 Tax=Styela clava TaxID=7725 RepID=UPI0019397070|nr:uncharacterized protein LOC120341766 [Styela clava]
MMKSTPFLSLIILFVSLAWSREIYSGNDIDLERLQGVWFLTLGVDDSSWNVLWKCHVVAPFNATENRMGIYSYNLPKNKSQNPHSFTDDLYRDHLGQIWHNQQIEKRWEEIATELYQEQPSVNTKIRPPSEGDPWFYSHPHAYSTDYSTFFSIVSSMEDDQKHLQIFTRTPTINDDNLSDLQAFAVEQGIDPNTLVTFGCGDLIPTDYLLDKRSA